MYACIFLLQYYRKGLLHCAILIAKKIMLFAIASFLGFMADEIYIFIA